MPAEEMGKASRKLRLAFAISSVVFVAVLAISPLKDYFAPWRQYKRAYARFANTRPDTKRLLADYHSGIDQIWIPELKVVDRCTTCHQGITQPSLMDASVPQPFRAHPSIPHHALDWGCVVCHRGQGLATEVREAHETTLGWEQPLLPTHFIQASCGVCHQSDIPETPQLNRGRQLLVDLNCFRCHRMNVSERIYVPPPDLSNIGHKASREWIYKWLKEPRTILDSDGNVVTNGYANEPRMPQFRLNDAELRDLSAFLSTRQNEPLGSHQIDPRIVAAWQKKPDVADQGETRFRQMFCTTCHAVAVTRAGQTQLIGGNIGPELTKIGSKVNEDWLIAWLRNPQSYFGYAQMPRYQWSDEDLYKVSRYIMTRLTDSDLLSDVPKMDPPTPAEIQAGKQLFVGKGCANCHGIQGIKAPKEFGPDLSAVGSKTVSELMFGDAKIPHTLVDYLRSKIENPTSVNTTAAMPQYHLKKEDVSALITALLSMTRRPDAPAFAKLVVRATPSKFQPAGQFGELYDRYKCYLCHQFNGYGGTLAPDLSFEGSRAQKAWVVSFLKNPQTLRPASTFRMPQFNFTDAEASTITDYLEMVMQSPQVNPNPDNSSKTSPELVALGKQLYEVKYQCQSCHTIGATGGYVGPNLSNLGSWMRPAWIAAWLKNPQALVPGTIEPRREFTDQEIQALSAFLMTLKQTPTSAKAGSAAGGSR
ncbi:MAG: c-type cytochrome [Acidobacteriia bacterium]|nr:c-type cytochrome [Terriglobia bacterium]